MQELLIKLSVVQPRTILRQIIYLALMEKIIQQLQYPADQHVYLINVLTGL